MCINPVHFWLEFHSASALALDGRMCPSPKRMRTVSEYGTSSTEAFPRDGSVNLDCPKNGRRQNTTPIFRPRLSRAKTDKNDDRRQAPTNLLTRTLPASRLGHD